MESCEKLSALLDAFIDGELPQAEADLVRRHLAECPDCRAYVADAFALRDVWEDLADVQVPEGFAQGVMEAVRNAPPQARRQGRSFRPVRILAPLAACLAIAAVVGLGPLSSRMTEDAAQTLTQETSAAADTAQIQQRDTTSQAQETDDAALEDAQTSQPYAAASSPQEELQESAPEAAGEESAQDTSSVPTTLQMAPENSALHQEEDAAADETPAPADTKDKASVSAARGDEDASDSQTQAGEYFTELTLTATQAGTLLDGVEAEKIVQDPDTGAELRRIYKLDRQQFQTLVEQLPDIPWTDSGSGDWARVIVEMQ